MPYSKKSKVLLRTGPKSVITLATTSGKTENGKYWTENSGGQDMPSTAVDLAQPFLARWPEFSYSELEVNLHVFSHHWSRGVAFDFLAGRQCDLVQTVVPQLAIDEDASAARMP